MIRRRAFAFVVAIFAIFFIAGCASPTRTTGHIDQKSTMWRGRLAVLVQADPQAQPQPTPSQSIGAAFELQGNAQQGSLILLTPLGSTAAAVHWTPDLARLQSNGQTREFASLNQLIVHLLGTNIPVTALFGWLDGQALTSEGWQVDLSQRDRGKILARRQAPVPQAELRVVLED